MEQDAKTTELPVKILFVENRQQTAFWDAIARQLEGGGHDISWVVQNRYFRPKTGRQYVIPYPSRGRGGSVQPLPMHLERITLGDRNINYFGGNWNHYPYYAAAIGEILDRANPSIVFGEATLFHERICIEECRRRSIPYLFPTSCRYPPGRFAFFSYDTLQMVRGSGERLADNEAQDLLRAIRNRGAVPQYMREQAPEGRWSKLVRKGKNDARILMAWLTGERFNTPAPWKKWQLQRALLHRRQDWDTIARRPRDGSPPFQILFPLQMQPEANLDVWGAESRDQAKVLRDLIAGTDNETTIVVKPNPKAKYELTDALLSVIESCPRVQVTAMSDKMEPLFQAADLIVTATGTVAMECAFRDKPCVVLSSNMKLLVPGAKHLRDARDIGAVVEELRKGALRAGDETAALAYLQWLVSGSHRGLISNPYSSPHCIEKNNLEEVGSAFRSAVESHRHQHG